MQFFSRPPGLEFSEHQIYPSLSKWNGIHLFGLVDWSVCWSAIFRRYGLAVVICVFVWASVDRVEDGVVRRSRYSL